MHPYATPQRGTPAHHNPPVARPMQPPPPPPGPPYLPPYGPYNPGPIGNGEYHVPGAPMYTPWMHAQPYNVPPYPPMHQPFPHLQRVPGAVMGAPQFQPWDYIHHPLPAPITLAEPTAMQAGNGQAPYMNDGRMGNIERAGNVERVGNIEGTGLGLVGATAASTGGTQTRKNYPNKQICNGVWRFAVQVVNDKTKHTFDARTDMVWDEFAERAYSHFDKPHDNVRLGYRVSGDTSAMSQLTCANDWEHALDRVKERVIATCTRAVGMELKDMDSSVKKASSARKGKGKRTRDDDIPPQPSSEAQHHLDCLLELQRHLSCDMHSKGGMRTFCWVKPTTANSAGGHIEMNHENMTLWAKHMSLGKTTKYLPPNIKKFDHPAKKKPCTTYPTPEVHIALNITPVQGVDSSQNHGSFIVSQGPITQPLSTSTHQVDPIASGMGTAEVFVVMDCLMESRGPTILEVLRLMDADEPREDLKYVNAYSELCDHDITNLLDIYTYPVELLASFGNLGRKGINNIRRYAWERLLQPLTCLRTGESDGDDEVIEVTSNKVSMVSTQEAVGSSQGVVRETTSGNHEYVTQGWDEIQQWVNGVERDDLGVDGSGSDADIIVVESEGEDIIVVESEVEDDVSQEV
ncbi:hypothetical protein BC826DRAFT_969203 [Russula brevipes]|nr:hypothetical protein BC826DRAFT_969203 [Russula brevipes]